MNPRDCLKSTLFQRWQRLCAPQDYTQGEMMWQPNTPTTPGKSLLITLHILPTTVCLLVLYSPWETGISQT